MLSAVKQLRRIWLSFSIGEVREIMLSVHLSSLIDAIDRLISIPFGLDQRTD